MRLIVNTFEKNQNDSFQSGGSSAAARDRVNGRVFSPSGGSKTRWLKIRDLRIFKRFNYMAASGGKFIRGPERRCGKRSKENIAELTAASLCRSLLL